MSFKPIVNYLPLENGEMYSIITVVDENKETFMTMKVFYTYIHLSVRGFSDIIALNSRDAAVTYIYSRRLFTEENARFLRTMIMQSRGIIYDREQ